MPAESLDIMILDPERATRRHLELALGPWGYTIAGYSDARSALQQLAAGPPRLLIAELLLLGMDGFELFQTVRAGPGGGDVRILCTTGVSWGRLNLPELLRVRFGARFLRKPFLKSELTEEVRALIGPGRAESAPPFANDWRIGVAEAGRLDELAGEFEAQLVRVGGEYGRRSARAQAQLPVRWRSAGDWIASQVVNISIGGLFIECAEPPRMDEPIQIDLELPTGSSLRARARVASRAPIEEASRRTGGAAGFGVELLEVTDEERRALERVVHDLRAEEIAAASDEPAEEARPVSHIWILLLGIDRGELLKRPGFLHRHDIQLETVTDLEAAIGFVAQQPPAICVLRESLLGPDPRKSLAPLTERLPKGAQVVLIGRTTLSTLIAAGLCDVVLRRDTSMEMLIEELRERLGVPRRRGPRIPFRGDVAINAADTTATGSLLNISTGGMLFRTESELAVGTAVELRFDLPDAPELRARGKVVRLKADRPTSAHLCAVCFDEPDQDTALALSRFVQSQVNFRDYFAWLKHAYFGGRLDW